MNIVIRNYQPSDKKGVIKVCHETGYMGESAKGRFDDTYLFGLLFCLYYVTYEPKNCFVAFDTKTDQIVGYILGSSDTQIQNKIFLRKIIPKIIVRTFLYTIWRYFKSFKALLYMRKANEIHTPILKSNDLLKEYPAHLHINVLPGYQNKGIGMKLLSQLEHKIRSQNIKGIHLITSERNTSAVPFYHKSGFSVYYTSPPGFSLWSDAQEVKSIVFVKKL
jgi:ribosomal protein S18 acetylase RimI-like enzyme